jgi:metallo-beta-lactamase class B
VSKSRNSTWQRFGFGLAVLLAMPALVHGQADPQSRSENQPVPPFRIIGNIYYVGASDITSFLIVTPSGDILLDGGFAETAPQIEANIRKLGFKLEDVKFLLNSHAHYDHAGGLAELKKRTGAQFVAMDGDAALLAAGGRGDFFVKTGFPPVKPDRVIHDGDTVSLGGTTMTAHRTAGHTRGCTSWSTVVTEDGKDYHVVFVGSLSVLSGYRLTGKESYPGIAADYKKSIAVLKALPCDVFLGPHGSFFNLTDKREALAKGATPNPFVDPAGYQEYLASSEESFRAELQRQRAGH